jgi:hypothetical protein
MRCNDVYFSGDGMLVADPGSADLAEGGSS